MTDKEKRFVADLTNSTCASAPEGEESEVLQQVRQIVLLYYPDAVEFVLESSDQGCYGFSIKSVMLGSGLSVTHSPHDDRYWEMTDAAAPLLDDIEWNGTIGEDRYGYRTVTCSRQPTEKPTTTADELIADLESRGLGWSLDHTGRLIEARIWKWPYVIGRYRPHQVEPLAEMLAEAMLDAGWDEYPVRQSGEEES